MAKYNPPISDPLAVLPPSQSPLAIYENWVRKNESLVRNVEDSLRTMVLFLPGRFGDAEVRSQTVYTAVDLLSFYHDSVLNRPRVSLQVESETSSAAVRVVKALMSAVQYTEVSDEQKSGNLTWLVLDPCFYGYFLAPILLHWLFCRARLIFCVGWRI
jgi:hypothetical protein